MSATITYFLAFSLVAAPLVSSMYLSDSSTTVAPSSTTAVPSTTTPAPSDTSSSTSSPAETSSAAPHTGLNATSFTCYGRGIGYYADVDSECKIYHFCILGEYNGQQVYQRISYMCLNGTVFDQEQLDCVNTTVQCADAPKHFEESNKVLRQSLLNGNTTTDSSEQS